MIVSAYQPYFAPFTGFFEKAIRSDALVLLDTVQFPRGTGWMSRNRFKSDKGELWLTIPVHKKGLGLQRIDQVRISREGRWAGKHLESLKAAYGNAAFFADHVGFLEEIFGDPAERLFDLNLRIILHLIASLGIRAHVILLSELGITAREPELSVEICKKLGASHFIAQKSAMKFLDLSSFRTAGIEPVFFTVRSPVYPQLWGRFIPGLSAFDLLFTCGPRARDYLVDA